MNKKFVDRESELKALEDAFASENAELIIIYGRRRVGKTELIKKFFENKPHLYFLADLQKEEQLLKMFSEIARLAVKKEYLRFEDWDGLFSFLTDIAKKEKLVVAFDEVGYINGAAFYSILQRFWDEYLQHTKFFLILCGSSVSMMERDVLGYRSPLYGRRTGQIELKPLTYKDSRRFFPGLDEAEMIEFYSVLGGVPAYLKQFDENKDVFENIEEEILDPDKFLYREPEFILLEELRDPTTYLSILTAISQGAHRFNEISQSSCVESTKLSKYLSVLLDLRLINRIRPVTERKEFRRNTLYSISDNLFDFWFKFVHPHHSLIEGGEIGMVMDLIRSDFDRFVSFAFEDVCRQALRELNTERRLPFTFMKVGKWWHKEDEIDIVALNDRTKEILLAECKWQEKKVGKDVVEELLRKKTLVDWNKDRRKEHYAIFSRSGFQKSCIEHCKENGIVMFDLKDIKMAFD